MSFDEDLGPALEEVEFLVRSENRVAVLAALTRGPVDRRGLSATTGVSRATLGRTLEDFTERGWVAASDGEYEATQLGAFVAREVLGLLERVSRVPALNEVARWFPEGGFGFDLDRLANAHVVRSTKREPQAPTAHIAARIRSAGRVRCLTYAVLPEVLAACREGVESGGLDLECVIESAAVTGVESDPALLERATALVAAEGSSVLVTPSAVGSTLFIANGTVLLCLAGDEGAPLAVIETGDPAVRFWAEDQIDAHRRDAEPLDPDAFTA